MKAQIVLKNNIQIDGIILENKDNQMTIRSLNGMLTTIIPSVSDSVAFYQINHARDTYDRLMDKSDKTDADLHELVDAKSHLMRQEQEEILEPFKKAFNEQFIYTPKSRSTQHTKKEVGRASTNFNTGLQKMFR